MMDRLVLVPGGLDLRRGEDRAEAVEAFEIVGEGDERPLVRDLLEAAQTEAPQPERFLDDAEDRLDGLLAQPDAARPAAVAVRRIMRAVNAAGLHRGGVAEPAWIFSRLSIN